jgi:hypothetical protein
VFFDFEFDLVTQEFTQMQQSQNNWLHNTGVGSGQIKIPDFFMGFGFGWVFGYPTHTHTHKT